MTKTPICAGLPLCRRWAPTRYGSIPIQADDFYEAFYEYNKDREEPLYLLQGVWVNDYIQNSHRDAYDDDFLGTFLDDCRTMVDVIHGNKKISLGRVASAGSGTYRRDVSRWVIGYILGVEWEDVTVACTNEKYAGMDGYASYRGAYLYTSQEASPFEAMLTQVGDKIIEYESQRYKQQRLIAFSNWPTTDPFTYPENVTYYFMKCASVDVKHIKSTEDFLAGKFASYHVIPTIRTISAMWKTGAISALRTSPRTTWGTESTTHTALI